MALSCRVFHSFDPKTKLTTTYGVVSYTQGAMQISRCGVDLGR